VKRITGLDWALLALGLLALSAAGAIGVTHFGDPIVCVVLLLVCFCSIIGVIYLMCACAYLYFGYWLPTLWEALPSYIPCILIFAAEFALRRRWKAEELHADSVIT
jgi:Na+/alanine symporter